MLDATKIRELVKIRGFSKEEFAKFLDYEYSGFNKALIRGNMKNYRVTKMAEILKVKKNELFIEGSFVNENPGDYMLKQKIEALKEKVKDQRTIISRQDELIDMYKKQIKDKEC